MLNSPSRCAAKLVVQGKRPLVNQRFYIRGCQFLSETGFWEHEEENILVNAVVKDTLATPIRLTLRTRIRRRRMQGLMQTDGALPNLPRRADIATDRCSDFVFIDDQRHVAEFQSGVGSERSTRQNDERNRLARQTLICIAKVKARVHSDRTLDLIEIR